MGERLFAALCAALFGWFVGKAMGVPIWRDWDMGDRSDLALLAFLCVWFAIGAARPTPSVTSESMNRDGRG